MMMEDDNDQWSMINDQWSMNDGGWWWLHVVPSILMLQSFVLRLVVLSIKFLQESWPLCCALLSSWVANAFKIEADDATMEPNEDHIKFKDFVKVDSKGLGVDDQPGKYGNHAIIPFVPYNLRSLVIFIADLVRAWELISMLPSFEEKHKQYQQ